MASLPADAAGLVPHGEPFRMVRRILLCDDDAKVSRVECMIDDSGRMFAAADGVVYPEVFLEVIAQSAAAQHGYDRERRQDRDGAESAFLVGVRNFEVTGEAGIGDVLEVSLECLAQTDSVCSLRGVVFVRGQQVAAAEISVWHGASRQAVGIDK